VSLSDPRGGAALATVHPSDSLRTLEVV
jgi:hypothetical protein